MKDLARSIAACTEAIDAGSKDAQVYDHRGFAYFIRDDYARTRADLDMAISLDPKSAEAYAHRGLVFRATGDDARAVSDFTQAITLGSSDARVLIDRGMAYFVLGAMPKAIADYDAAIARDGDRTFVGQLGHMSRGIAYYYGGALEKAQADFRKAADLDAKHAHAWIWLHFTQKRLGVPSDLAAASQGLDMTRWPGPVVRMLLGTEGAAEVVKVSEGTPAICEADFYAAEFTGLEDRKDEAVALYRKAVKDCRRHHLEGVTAAAALRALGLAP